MKVRITFEADDRLRAAIRRHYGESGKASYAEVVTWFYENGNSASDDILDEAGTSPLEEE